MVQTIVYGVDYRLDYRTVYKPKFRPHIYNRSDYRLSFKSGYIPSLQARLQTKHTVVQFINQTIDRMKEMSSDQCIETPDYRQLIGRNVNYIINWNKEIFFIKKVYTKIQTTH